MSQTNTRHFLFAIRVSPVHLFVVMSGVYPPTLKVSKNACVRPLSPLFNMPAAKSRVINFLDKKRRLKPSVPFYEQQPGANSSATRKVQIARASAHANSARADFRTRRRSAEIRSVCLRDVSLLHVYLNTY